MGEADAVGGELLHVGGAVEVVEGLFDGVAVFIDDEGDGGVHETHVIDEEDDDVGGGRGLHSSRGLRPRTVVRRGGLHFSCRLRCHTVVRGCGEGR